MNYSPKRSCKVGVAFGQESDLYSFPVGHPMNNSRTSKFAKSLQKISKDYPDNISIFKPIMAHEKELLLFHIPEYVEFVKKSSNIGKGFLDYGDTPSFKGIYEASLYPVGNTLSGLKRVLKGDVDHFFNPIGGLHHARRDGAGGFCVFNDAAIIIAKVLKSGQFKKVAYIDIDAHHGDGVFYGFERDPNVIIGDIHEDGRYLYPGTGFASESGNGSAAGTKLNIPLPPSSGDKEFYEAFDRIEAFVRDSGAEIIFFQCGADGLAGDPITHLTYSSRAHGYAAEKLHSLSHELCQGRIVAMGGGGYAPENVDAAWSAIIREFGNIKNI